MIYTKQTWLDGIAGGTPISADRLSHLENGIDGIRNFFTPLSSVSVYSPFTDYGSGAAVGDNVADDAPAIQAAINAASTAGGGYVGPLGTHRCLSGLIRRRNVYLFGRGYGHSLLWFPTDLGAGHYAIDFDAADPVGAIYAGGMRDFQVIGPGGGSLGVQGAAMDGIRPMAHSSLENVAVSGFRAGFVNYWDHIFYKSCRSETNYYNVLFPPNPGTSGNQSFIDCIFTGAQFASVAIAGNCPLDATSWINTHLGFGPYGIYRADMGAPSSTSGITGSVFDGLGFEYCGNAAILDETTGGGSGSDSMLSCVFNNCGYSGSADTTNYRIASRSSASAMVLRNWRGGDIFESENPFSVPPGGTSIFSIRTGGVVQGVVDHRPQVLLPTGAGRIIATPDEGAANGFTVDLGDIKGVIRTAIFSIRVGELLQHEITGNRRVQRMSSTGTFAGVALTDGETSSAVLVARAGQETLVLCEAVSAAGAAIRPLSGTEHHGTTAGTGPIIGYSASPGGGSGGVGTYVVTRSP